MRERSAFIGVRTCSVESGRLGTVTYHDDNSDGFVDFEMHDFGCCDRNWALVDSDFDGTFDLRVQWGESFTEEPVEEPVPSFVSIAPWGSGWSR